MLVSARLWRLMLWRIMKLGVLWMHMNLSGSSALRFFHVVNYACY